MPRTLSTSDMVTPSSPSLPPTNPTDGEQASQPILDGAPSSASLDTLIQHLVPTADYYPEVGGPPGWGCGAAEWALLLQAWGREQGWGWSRAWGGARHASPCPGEHVQPFSRFSQKAYIFTFLLSSRLFIEPRELLARVCHLCIEQQQLDKPVLDKVRGRAKQGCLSTLALP